MPDSSVVLYVLDAAPSSNGSLGAGTYNISGTQEVVYSNEGNTAHIDPANDLLDGQTFTISQPDRPQFDMADGNDIPFNTGFVLYFTLDDGTVLVGWGDDSGPDNTNINSTPFDEIAANGSAVESITTNGVGPGGSTNTWDTYYLGGVPGAPAPCFTSNSFITTATGEKRMDDLVAGDRILTRDNGYQTLRWIYSRDISIQLQSVQPSMRPILFRKDSLAPNMPDRDVWVSPGHLMLATARTAEVTGSDEVLIPARQFLKMGLAAQSSLHATKYFHLLFDAHQVVQVNGMWSESFQPSISSLQIIGDARNEIFEIFPELATQNGIDAYAGARKMQYARAARDTLRTLSAGSIL